MGKIIIFLNLPLSIQIVSFQNGFVLIFNWTNYSLLERPEKIIQNHPLGK
jgi:hypothetical protein